MIFAVVVCLLFASVHVSVHFCRKDSKTLAEFLDLATSATMSAYAMAKQARPKGSASPQRLWRQGVRYVPERLDDLKGRKRAPLMQVGDSNVARRLFGGHSEHECSFGLPRVCTLPWYWR